MKNRFLLIIFAITLLAGCEKAMDFTIEEQTPLVVVNCAPTVGDTLCVKFTYSRFFLSNEPFETIAGVDAKVFVNGVSYTLTQREQGDYFADYIVQEDDDISITATLPDGTQIASHTVVPKRPVIDSLVIDTNRATGLMPTYRIRFVLQDIAGVKNYYRLWLTEHVVIDYHDVFSGRTFHIDTLVDVAYSADWTLTSHDCASTRSASLFKKDTVNAADTLREADPLFYFTALEYLFTDRSFDGQSLPVALELPRTGYLDGLLSEYTLTLHIESLSPENFRYRETARSGTGAVAMFTEPRQVPTNISGAMGVFAGAAPAVFNFDLIHFENNPHTETPNNDN